MAQRSKGLRKQICMPRHMPAFVPQVIASRAAAAGTGTLQYLADLLAFAVGRPDLARVLTQASIDYPEPLLPNVKPPANPHPRVDIEVYQLITAAGAKSGTSASAYLLDVCIAHIAGEPLPALPKAKEELRLTG